MICLRQNEGEFSQAKISDYIVKQVRTKRSTALFALIYTKLFSSAARKFTFHFAEGKLSFGEADYHSARRADHHSAEGGRSFSRSETCFYCLYTIFPSTIVTIASAPTDLIGSAVQMTTSASLPTSRLPTRSAISSARAGLMVIARQASS